MTGAIILAAGQGRRMKSDLPKVMHPVLGRPMILRVLESAGKAGFCEMVVVVGHGRENLTPLLDAECIPWVVQEQQLGTAHAVQCGLAAISSLEIAVLLGDVPLLEHATITELINSRRRECAAIAVLTTRPPDAAGYGRVIRTGGCSISEIVEERDATPDQLETDEINTGLMAFDGETIRTLLDHVSNDNSQGEYYLTDCIGAAVSMGLPAIAIEAADWREVAGINDPAQLDLATGRLRELVVRSHMENGVSIPDPGSVWIEETVSIGSNSLIGKGCRLTGHSVIGRRSRLGEGCIVNDAIVSEGTVLEAFTIIGGSERR
jgi:bifunctional UDP-N-acetylglucosamine pyrophosphorylase/glucosamine-1-phosphate N-acetyltransferase